MPLSLFNPHRRPSLFAILVALLLVLGTMTAVYAGSAWASPVTVDSAAGDVGQYTSLAVVDGYPAISYYDNTNKDLKYVRATNAAGSAWASPVTVDSAGTVGQYTSLAVVDGYPAISYYDSTNGDLKYVRAVDAAGSAWASPVTVDSAGTVGQYTSLAAVDGYPAISYSDYSNGDLKYVRAVDAAGSAWASPVTVDNSDMMVGLYTSLAEVNGYPAISYYDNTNGDLKYVRAVDAAGSAWASPVTLDSADTVGQYTSLAVVDGYPAISYYDGTNRDLKYVRAADAAGSAWTSPVTLDNGDIVGQSTSLAVVDGYPAISYYDSINTDLKYVRAVDAAGSAWASPVTVDGGAGAVGFYTSLAVVDGYPAISYYDSINGNLKYIYCYNNIAPLANAGSDQTVTRGDVVTLDGSGSSDPDGHTPLSYSWTQTGGPSVTLSSAGVDRPTFTAPTSAAVLTFSLTVTDSLGLADPSPDVVVVTVELKKMYLPLTGKP